MERERLCSDGAAVTPKRNDMLPPPTKHSIASLLLVCTALLPGLLATPARAATMILHNFTGGPGDGQNPYGSPTLSDSTLYGMTRNGGINNEGVLFSMNTDGSGYSLLHNFTGVPRDGSYPYGSLTLSSSKLYGMTEGGGRPFFHNGTVISDNGTVFSINTDGTGFSLLHSFGVGPSDGGGPFGSLTLSETKLYGMTAGGGSDYAGTIFSMNTDGTGYNLLHNFSGADGDKPNYGSLTLSGTKLYGMTADGGSSGYAGTLFSMNTDGTGFALLHSFNGGVSDGTHPYSSSLVFSGSKLYGMTNEGGTNGTGTLFCINTDGTGFALLHSFDGGADDGQYPFGALTLSGSTLYGMTATGGSRNAGTIFGINTDGTDFTLLESFGGAEDGATPGGQLTLSDDGSTLYGMTVGGGAAGQGVIFSRAVPEPTSAALLLGSGAMLLLKRRRAAGQ